MKDNHDIENRKQIWIALSEFYLDTQLTHEDFDRISTIFQSSGLHINDIKEIDLLEVFPLLQTNLVSATGSWAGFDEDWLVAECKRRYKRRNNVLHKLGCKFWNSLFYSMRRDYWEQIEKRINLKT
jgi:hypothetical protein